MKVGIVLFLKHVPSLPPNLFPILYLYGFLDSIQRKVLSVSHPSSPTGSVVIN